MTIRAGGCLCGACRYEVEGEPRHVTVCHCSFCQTATGAPYLIEPIFAHDKLKMISGQPSTCTIVSKGSGKQVHVHFCAACGTKLHLSFERFADVIGLYGGTLDQPGSILLSPEDTYHIFLDEARPGTIIPAGYRTYRRHRLAETGEALDATTFEIPHLVQ